MFWSWHGACIALMTRCSGHNLELPVETACCLCIIGYFARTFRVGCLRHLGVVIELARFAIRFHKNPLVWRHDLRWNNVAC